MSCLVLILAAGKGTRFGSAIPKPLQLLGGKPLIFHLLGSVERFKTINADQLIDIAIVHGNQADLYNAINPHCPETIWLKQSNPKGTGDAVKKALPILDKYDSTMILLADVPLIYPETLDLLAQKTQKSGFTLLTTIAEDPFGYGRVVRDHRDCLMKVVEEKSASFSQKLITEINTGVMMIKNDRLIKYLPMIGLNNIQEEFCLPDLIELMYKDGLAMETILTEDSSEVLGINNRADLADAEKVYRFRKSQELLEAGVTLIDPERIDIHGTLEAGQDCLIEPNVFFKGNVVLGNRVVIESGCCLTDCDIGDDVWIKNNSVINGAKIEQGVQIGPFAHIRPKTHIFSGAKIGNFVEIKQSQIGENSKINHLSYLGNADLGKKCNIGAGVISCNYDGANKWPTKIGNEVFVGSNSSLIAPIVINDGATIGAGSVITKNVDNNQLALTRANLRIKNNYQRKKSK